ncbi:manganese/zinc/iron transport system permease protein [Oikeobacillus pervagus]|uniref:Manganese transport system membrane protein MntC n=1 Tax=Oikeobacillus pervagus TaxID=1325931 RepID=A0AAJ1T0R9_9BACI|nr:iron chelate uptake ABC transporter family permease subunit [Oikeobacillus pervagus]MDQ0216443.1 manganese/zinc/iron transport system permease protein [Oikeobacillus pervagus]
MLGEFWKMLLDANTQWVLIGTLLLGLASGVLGSFALLRKQSLLGDAMAHAALPGICIAYLFTGTKSISWFLIGAAIAGLVATYFIQSIIKHSRLKEDSSIGLVLSVFFGIGIVLLTYINQQAAGNQSGLNDFIFGQAASLVGTDVKVISGVALVLLILTTLLFKEFKIITFDHQFAKGIGMPTTLLNGLLMTLIVGAVVIGLQAVGVILMAAMLITPAISARYWTERLDHMVIIAGAIGAFSGILGTLLSTTKSGMPTGPLIIMAATIIFLFSMIFAPQRGLLMKALKQRKMRKVIARESVLQTLFDFIEERIAHGEPIEKSGFDEKKIAERRAIRSSFIHSTLHSLKNEGLVEEAEAQKWRLTAKGMVKAHDITLKNRLMEVYLMNEMKYAQFNISQDQESDIHQLPPNIIEELKGLLALYGRKPMEISQINMYQQRGLMAK